MGVEWVLGARRGTKERQEAGARVMYLLYTRPDPEWSINTH